MKEKIKIIILIIAFIVILISITALLDKQNENKIADNGTKNSSASYNEEGKEMESVVLEVNDKNFESEVLNSEKTVLIDFYASWCGPCKILSPIVEEVAKENSDIKVVKVNVDESNELAINYQVMSIPTLVVIKNREEVDRFVGVMEKSEIIKMVK